MTTKVKVLVVEDETPVAMLMVFLFARAGHDAESAWNAEKALRLAAAGKFDLITLDVDMPGISGFELFRRLKQIPHLKETPIVFVSGNATIENQQYALELGAVDFIEKPFGAEDFVPRILSFIKKSPAASDVLHQRADADTQSFCNSP